MKQITHLIFSGNALKSVVLCGVLRYIYFHKLDSHIHDVSATSMGSFFALAFALKIPIEKLEAMILELASDETVTKVNPSALMNIINNYGLCSSLNYLKIFRNYLKEVYDQDDITFLELSKKTGVNVYVTTTRVDTGRFVVFNVNDTPNVSVLSAVAASMCIPLISEPIKIDGFYYIDGFMSNNFPCEVFSHVNKKNILAIAGSVHHLYDMMEVEKGTDFSFFEYFYKLSFIFHLNNFKLCYANKVDNFEDILLVEPLEVKSLCVYDKENKCLDFSLSEEELNSLYLAGYKAIHNYMKERNKEDNYCNNLGLDCNLPLELEVCEMSSNFQEM